MQHPNRTPPAAPVAATPRCIDAGRFTGDRKHNPAPRRTHGPSTDHRPTHSPAPTSHHRRCLQAAPQSIQHDNASHRGRSNGCDRRGTTRTYPQDGSYPHAAVSVLTRLHRRGNDVPGGHSDLGACLGALRRRADLSQRELAQRASVPPSTVSSFESGDVSNPRLQTLKQIVEAAIARW